MPLPSSTLVVVVFRRLPVSIGVSLFVVHFYLFHLVTIKTRKVNRCKILAVHSTLAVIINKNYYYHFYYGYCFMQG